MSNIDRRDFFRRLGLGIIALGPVGSLAGMVGSKNTAREAEEANLLEAVVEQQPKVCPGMETHSLLTPLQIGSRVASSTLQRIKAYPHYLSLEMKTDRGEDFKVDICGRDNGPGAPRPVTRTERYDLFVANGGNGDKWTSREHGLAAYTVADVLAGNEKRAGQAKLRTLRHRNAWT